MKKLFASRRSLVITIAVAVVLIGLGVFLALWSMTFFWPYAITLAAGIALWFGLEWWLDARARRKQAAFDVAVAAKEGIDDRRREWEAWTGELKKQGIDRHALPFYLLLGEPQSGKSVLLHNSDLHFPFGQNRLSGVGGTRGCDWWFTEEAVILDLAGRLFTHEGGASDEAEWQAFLDLLSNFRPMCPANGVLLVLPCDGLLSDQPEEAAKKASRMQNALLTLVQRLQVQLPVYVVLTKGDKIFGFAESVHRLETEKRHEMFGWSRPSDKVETPFSLDEARDGFATILTRCRALRSQMLGTARIPEALGEVDRLYAFPEEFAQALPNLEIYLRRIFTESALVERLFFRGIYLTSGLQTGAPIAKACADLLGGAHEADARNLESLFAKQRAYFIKDLVRKRVFEERGVVRPTKRRAVSAKRNAWIGYGVGGAITVATLVAIANYWPASARDVQFFVDAKDTAVKALKPEPGAPPASLPDLLRTLDLIGNASTRERPFLERVLPFGIGGTKTQFQHAYVLFFDRTIPPALRAAAEEQLAADLATDAPDHAEYRRRLDGAVLLLQPIPWQDEAAFGRLAALIAPEERVAAGGSAQGFDVVAARKLRLECDDDALPPPTGPEGSDGRRSAALDDVVARMTAHVGDAFDFRNPAHVEGDLGKFAAWSQSIDAYTRLVSNPAVEAPTAQADAEYYLITTTILCGGSSPAARLPTTPKPRVMSSLKDEFETITKLRDQLVEGASAGEWAVAKKIDERLAKAMLDGAAGAKDPTAAATKAAGALVAELGAKPLDLPLEHEVRLAGKPDEWREFFAACDPNVLPVKPLSVATLPADVKRARERWLTKALQGTDTGALTLAKIHGTLHHYRAAFDPDANAAALDDLCLKLNAPKTPDFAPAVIGHLVDLHDECAASDKTGLAEPTRTVDALLLAYLTRVDRSFATATATDPYLDGVAVSAFNRASDGSRFDAPVAKAAGETRRSYLEATRTATLRWWNGSGSDDESVAAAHLIRLFGALKVGNDLPKELTAGGGHGDWLRTLDGVVAARVRRHRERLSATWDVDPMTFDQGELKTVAQRAADLVREPELSRRCQSLQDSKLRRVSEELADTEKLEPRMAETIPELKKLLAALDPPQAAALVDKTPTQWLRDGFAKAIAAVNDTDFDSRHDFAQKWCDVDAKLRERPDPSTDLAGFYVANVLAALDRRLLRDLRGWFVEEFERGFLSPNDRPTWQEHVLGRGSSEGSATFSTLARWLDRPGTLDQISAAFKLRGKGRTIRPGADEVADGSRVAWDALAFLEQLQTFLLGADQQAIGEAKIRLTIRPDLDQTGTVWWPSDPEATRIKWFGVTPIANAGPQQLQQFSVDAGIRTNPDRAQKQLEWSCSPGASPMLSLGWNQAFEMPADTLVSADRERYLQTFPGPLGVLHFAWSGRPGDASAAADLQWKTSVNLGTAGKPPLPAPFKLTFDRPLPRRPASLEQRWSR